VRYRILFAVAALVACKVREGRKVTASLNPADSMALSQAADSLEALYHRLHSGSHNERPDSDQAAVAAAWRRADRRIADVTARTVNSPVRDWLVGDVYYAAWDLDMPNAFDSAESHLSRSLTLDSAFFPPRLSLARLYINSGPGLAAKGERLLREARVPPGSAEDAKVHEGLAFALAFQGRAHEAAAEAALVLAHDSTNQVMRMMRDAYGRNHAARDRHK